MASNSDIGKKAESKIYEWLNKPDEGYSFDRIYDQMTGFFGSSNICDFTCFKAPYMYYIESKATYEDRFDFSMLTTKQHDGLLEKSVISNVFGLVIVLFALYKRAFILDIRDIKLLEDQGIKSLNIKKRDKKGWPCKSVEIQTIPNNRKQLLDYTGHIEEYVQELKGN